MKSMYYDGFVYGYCRRCGVWYNALTGKVLKEINRKANSNNDFISKLKKYIEGVRA